MRRADCAWHLRSFFIFLVVAMAQRSGDDDTSEGATSSALATPVASPRLNITNDSLSEAENVPCLFFFVSIGHGLATSAVFSSNVLGRPLALRHVSDPLIFSYRCPSYYYHQDPQLELVVGRHRGSRRPMEARRLLSTSRPCNTASVSSNSCRHRSIFDF